ncbi:hypothetical protein I79_009876 [Cricetulus griseus]|uniref:Uncharacterized protein n=1 Tax=Cricetulus griseus TaxID=10029 RepID=G3HGY2_CRIGR|nr:hypothetical protein I79_009876 [Cricetulus griseus]
MSPFEARRSRKLLAAGGGDSEHPVQPGNSAGPTPGGQQALVPQHPDCPTPPVFRPDSTAPASSRAPSLPFPSFLAPDSPVPRPVTFPFLGPQTPGSLCAAAHRRGRPDPSASEPAALHPEASRIYVASRRSRTDADRFRTAQWAGKEPLAALHFKRRFCPEAPGSQTP